MTVSQFYPAPSWTIDQWFNTPSPLSVEGLRGKVIVIGAFQMLCPGCVTHGLPQLIRVWQLFDKHDVSVFGIHTVFEHHDAMTPVSLAAFLHEYHIDFPVGIDAKDLGGDPIPTTMRRYEMRGTPTTILIDRAGYIRGHYFGQVDDLKLGSDITRIMLDPAANTQASP